MTLCFAVTIPLYERHDKGIKEEFIPHNINVLFKEVIMNHGLNPKEVLELKQDYNGVPSRVIPDKTLVSLSQRKVEIMVGDVATPDLYKDDTIEIGEIIAGLALLSGSAGIAAERKRVDQKIGVTRRKLLQAGMVAAGAWGLSKLPVYLGTELELDQKEAVGRIFTRFTGTESNLHPELGRVFLGT